MEKKLRIILFTSLLTLSCLFFIVEKRAYAFETYSTQKELKVSSVGIKKLKIKTPKNLSGKIYLHTWEEPEVLVKYEKKIKAKTQEEAKRVSEMIEVSLQKSEDEAKFEIYTSFNAPLEKKGYKANLNLDFFIPKELDLETFTRNFDLAIFGPLKKVDLNSSLGRIHVKEVKENTQIRTSFGEVIVEDISGGVNIETSYKPIKAERINTKKRSAFFRNNHEKIEIEEFKGALEVETSYAPIIAKGLFLIDGENKFENSHSGINLEIDSLSFSELEIDNSYGDVNIFLHKNSSFELSFSVGSGGKIHTKGIVITPKLIEKTRLKGTCGEGESLLEVFVNGIGKIYLEGIERKKLSK